jgi:hypothetical protein
MRDLGSMSFHQALIQREILYCLSQKRDPIGKFDLVDTIQRRKTNIRKQIVKLTSQSHLTSEYVYIGEKRKKKEIISIETGLHQQITTLISSVKIVRIEKLLIQEAVADIAETNPPEYPESYFADLYEEIKFDRISGILGLVEI